MDKDERTYTAFAGERRLVTGELSTMLGRVKTHLDDGGEPILIFDDTTGRQIDFDFRGTPEEVLARAMPPRRRAGPGRPKLGVVSREVSLLPRHWEWLEQRGSGISATLRRLVDDARKREPPEERSRVAREAASTFMWAMAGDLPGFEEASRALFARDLERLETLVGDWPPDIRAHALEMVRRAEAVEAGGSPS